MTLPILTTADDVREIVRYLKNKPTGATMAELKATVHPQALDGRKLAAYQAWGFVTRDGDRFKLTARGWNLGRKPDSEKEIFREVLDSNHPYRSVAEWASHQEISEVSNVDVAAHWHDHHPEALGTTNENTIKAMAVCFFHVAQAAGIGKLVMGRRGQPTRLVVDTGELDVFIEAGPSTPPWETSEESAFQPPGALGGTQDMDEPPTTPTTTPSPPAVVVPSDQMRVFISHGKNADVVDQIQTMLSLAGFESEVAEKEETAAIPVPEKVFTAMRRCHAGIIAVTVEEGKKDSVGNYSINHNVLIEIGAAFVLYDKRVVLLWDKRIPVPSNLQGLYRCEFEGGELSWTAGMKLMKAIQGFKRHSGEF